MRVYSTPDLLLDPALVTTHRGDRAKACEALIAPLWKLSFGRCSDEDRRLSVLLRSGQHKVLYRGDLVSGATLTSLVQRAKERAIGRAVHDRGPPRVRDGRISRGRHPVPNDESEEWQKLLDHHPEQVVGMASSRRGRFAKEQLLVQIFKGVGPHLELMTPPMRLFGVEIEYRIMRADQGALDPVVEAMELVLAHLTGTFERRWDYSGEDPHEEAHGFRVSGLQQDNYLVPRTVSFAALALGGCRFWSAGN